MALLEFQNLHKRYKMGETIVSALRGVSLSIEEGDFVAIMGPSGSGKSTLMHLMGLLDAPTEGSYKIRGQEVAHLSEDDLAVMRREVIGFIFQQFNLLPRMNATENVSLPLLYSEGKLDPVRAVKLLDRVGLGTRLEHRPNELSGGQQQRVAIARSMINAPLILFADEPTGNLDSQSEKEILAALRELNSQGITIVIVTHEEEIGSQAKRVIRMRDGVIQSDERLQPLPAPPRKVNRPKGLIKNPGTAAVSFAHIAQHFHQGAKTLLANKVRTALSMLGILIGVAAVVAMLALGRGAQNAIEAQLASLGSNLLILRPGALRTAGSNARGQVGGDTRLTLEDAQSVREQIQGVKQSAPVIYGRGQVTYGNKNWNTQIQGVAPSYARMHSLEPKIGRFFTNDELKRRTRVAVIGATLVRELFDGADPIGEMIKINRVNFQVIGVLPERGANAFTDQDDLIVTPVTTAMFRLLGRQYVDSIEIEVNDALQTASVMDASEKLMLSRHRVPLSMQQDAFNVRNMQDIQDALTATTRVMTLLLSVIAAISLVVGGIGIMNIMLVSVTERTREIGLRKAVGARRADILTQFLVEAVVISGMGGLLGIALAWIVTVILSAASGWATSISASSVFLSFFFSASIGVIFGLYPARQASLLNPIDALRYE